MSLAELAAELEEDPRLPDASFAHDPDDLAPPWRTRSSASRR